MQRLSGMLILICGGCWAEETVDLTVIYRIKAEAFQNSKVMEHLSYLTDVHGPRLTASPNFRAAGEWAVTRLKQYGLADARLEAWGPFGRSWSCSRFRIELVAPQYAPLIGIPLAWSAATNGRLVAEPMLAPLEPQLDPEKGRAEMEKFKGKYRGKLKGRMVMLSPVKDVPLGEKADCRRYTEAELADIARAPMPGRRFDYSKLAIPEDPDQRGPFLDQAPSWFWEALQQKREELREDFQEFLRREGVLVVLESGPHSTDGTVFGQAAGSRKAKYPLAIPSVALTSEHYNRIARLLERKIGVSLAVDLALETSAKDVDAFNVLAEIPGSKRKDEVVIVGGHFDSWAGGTGATDNGCGSAVAMEVVRILKALNLPLDRTVRLGLWGGEEQGLLGSKAYVKRHLADPETMDLKPEHAKISGYFNLDNGCGKIRGVYLQNGDAERLIFERWLAPFHDLGVTTISIRETKGTDHLSFDAVGIPGYQFIQDPLEYGTRTHHSNMDVYDHAPMGDLMQASAVMASMVYLAATRQEMLPRKPLPKPQLRPKLE